MVSVSFPQLEELISPKCRPKPRINEERSSWRLVFHGASSQHTICRADIRIHKTSCKVSIGLTRDSWCTRGNAGWRSSRVESEQPRVRWSWPKAQGVNETRNQPAWKRIPKGTWCRCAVAPNLGLPSTSCLQEIKSSWTRKDWTQLYHFDHFTLKELWSWNTKNLKTQPILYQKTLACYQRKRLPVREGDTRGTEPLRIEAFKLRPQVTSYQVRTLGAVFLKWGYGCAGCCARERQ